MGHSVQIRFGGSGGQGLILGARILFRAMSLEGKSVSQSQNYEPTSRGGFCNSDLVAADSAVDYPLVTAIDYLLLLDQVGVAPSQPMLKPGAVVIADQRLVTAPPEGAFTVHKLPLTDRAITLGSQRVANIIGLSALCGFAELCSREALQEAIKHEAPERFLDMNFEAIDAGYQAMAAIAS